MSEDGEEATQVIQAPKNPIRKDGDGHYLFPLPCELYIQQEDGEPVGDEYTRIEVDEKRNVFVKEANDIKSDVVFEELRKGTTEIVCYSTHKVVEKVKKILEKVPEDATVVNARKGWELTDEEVIDQFEELDNITHDVKFLVEFETPSGREVVRQLEVNQYISYETDLGVYTISWES